MTKAKTADTATGINLPRKATKALKEKGIFTDGFANFVSRVGQRTNNVNANGLYIFDMLTRNRIMLEAMYRGSWVVGVVVDSMADDMTRAGIQITSSDAAESIEDIQAALSQMQIFNSLADLIRWGRLYGGAIGVLQLEGQKLDSPLDYETVSKGQFKGIAVYDRWQVNPDMGSSIKTGPEIGLPEFYQLVTTATSSGTQAQPKEAADLMRGGVKVHHSRIIRQIGIPLPFYQAQIEMYWGESVVERLWDRLNSFDTATLSTAQLVNRAYLRTVKVDGLREILSSGGKAEEALINQFKLMRELQTNEGLTIMDKLDEFEANAYSFAGLSDVILQFGQQISGAAEIPLVRMFGQAPAGLNATGESDIRMYYDKIKSLQEARLRAGMEKILKCTYRSEFGEAMPKDMQFKFTPLWQLSATDQATVAKSNTETILGAFDSGVTDLPTTMKELRQASPETGLFSNITDEMIADAEANPPVPVLPGVGDDPAADPKAAGGKSPVPNLGKTKDSAGGLRKWAKRWIGR